MRSIQVRVKAALDEMVEQLRPFPARGRLLVGVSGGPDSMALLHLLTRIYTPDKLAIAHLDHGLRDSSETEARFVAETAAKWDISCHIERVDVAGLAFELGMSIEEAGREARYRYFAAIAERVDAAATAVAHHADDQAESILMHLLRGSGLAGLRGMAAVAPMPGHPERLLVRPMLRVTREEIERYCHSHGLSPLLDSSNLDVSIRRNWLRHELIPLLSEYNPQFRTGLQQTSDILSADYAHLENVLDAAWRKVLGETGTDWLELDRSSWNRLPLSMRRGALRRAVLKLRPNLRDIAFRPIEQARHLAEADGSGGQVALPGGLIMLVDHELLVLASALTAIPVDSPQLPGDASMILPIPGQVPLMGGWRLESSIMGAEAWSRVESNRDQWLAFVDISSDCLIVRSRRQGEVFRPLGMRGHRQSVKKAMINCRIPARLRAFWPIVSTEEHLIWIVGHRLDERLQVTTESRHIVRLRCHRPSAMEKP